jgi:hypothetical protein
MSIFIKYHAGTGKILAWGSKVQGIEYTGELPEDFNVTTGDGKYTFDGTNINEVDGWVASPEPEPRTRKSS